MLSELQWLNLLKTTKIKTAPVGSPSWPAGWRGTDGGWACPCPSPPPSCAPARRRPDACVCPIHASAPGPCGPQVLRSALAEGRASAAPGAPGPGPRRHSPQSWRCCCSAWQEPSWPAALHSLARGHIAV